jgi:hypothetical protein
VAEGVLTREATVADIPAVLALWAEDRSAHPYDAVIGRHVRNL